MGKLADPSFDAGLYRTISRNSPGFKARRVVSMCMWEGPDGPTILGHIRKGEIHPWSLFWCSSGAFRPGLPAHHLCFSHCCWITKIDTA